MLKSSDVAGEGENGVKTNGPAAGASKKSAPWRKFINALIAAEISQVSRYCQQLIQYLPLPNDTKLLLSSVDAPEKTVMGRDELATRQPQEGTVILLNGNFNHAHDIEGMLSEIRQGLTRSCRVMFVLYNAYHSWLYRLASQFGLRKGEQPSTFITEQDLKNVAALAGFSVVRVRPVGFCPFPLWGIGNIINSVLATVPIIRRLSLVWVVTLRPTQVTTVVTGNSTPGFAPPTLSIVIPARNERGNIEAALTRMPLFGGKKPEIIFVEGHSSDNTWEEIQRVSEVYKDQFKIQSFKQTGRGKADAVRLGFQHATGELLTILDADLTMPPELLPRFYNAWARGDGDFINGNRLLYPMEGEAMKFLNWLGNMFFAKALSFVLDAHFGDSLCGTKLMSKRDYLRFIEWRKDFGDFDPFGDFEMIFPAAILALGSVDIPIRYRDRVYGTTNIRRFYHGAMLLKMTLIGLLRIKLGKQAVTSQA